MPSWRPAGASDPDGQDEWRFGPLADQSPALADALLDHYARRWLDLAHLPERRLPEVPDTVDLVVAPDWSEPEASGLLTLRLRSWYTGSTYWMPGWDGTPEDAERWIDGVAELEAGNVDDEREYGPTEWDDPAEWTPPPAPPSRPPGFHGVIEDHDPGHSGARLNAVKIESAREPSAQDVALTVDRLTDSPEIPPEVVSEARARAAQGSPRAFFEWLSQELREHEDEPEPIDCDCGAALIDPSTFRGRATVRCGRCGARWGVDVDDGESWSQWSLESRFPEKQ